MLKSKNILLVVFLALMIATILDGRVQLNIISNGNDYFISISLSIISIIMFLYIAFLYKISSDSKLELTNYSPGLIFEYLSVIIDFFCVVMFSIVPAILIILLIENISTNTFNFSFTRNYFTNRDIIANILAITSFIFMFLLSSISVRSDRRSIGQYFMNIYIKKEYLLSKRKSLLRLIIGMITFPFWIFTPKKKQLLHNRLFKISVLIERKK